MQNCQDQGCQMMLPSGTLVCQYESCRLLLPLHSLLNAECNTTEHTMQQGRSVGSFRQGQSAWARWCTCGDAGLSLSKASSPSYATHLNLTDHCLSPNFLCLNSAWANVALAADLRFQSLEYIDYLRIFPLTK